MTMKNLRIGMAGFALVAALGLAGCGGGGGGSDGGTPAAKDASTLRTSDSPMGKILVDGKGRTLYLFTSDGKNSNSMKCDAKCVKEWPHMEGKPKAGAGARADLIATTKGSGTAQATYAGHPLYYYADDHKAGDTKGQGIDQIWYVLDSHGNAIKKAAPGGTGKDNDTGGNGY
ncbi:COG4315 family predicted lipoprotein [Streptomyces sp. BH105]|uniref:COG4315 family predicted lipoprotein n=1 Tax=Streptomyces sp. BH105 TaxID=3410408 RepID=UPI003CF52EBC